MQDYNPTADLGVNPLNFLQQKNKALTRENPLNKSFGKQENIASKVPTILPTDAAQGDSVPLPTTDMLPQSAGSGILPNIAKPPSITFGGVDTAHSYQAPELPDLSVGLARTSASLPQVTQQQVTDTRVNTDKENIKTKLVGAGLSDESGKLNLTDGEQKFLQAASQRGMDMNAAVDLIIQKRPKDILQKSDIPDASISAEGFNTGIGLPKINKVDTSKEIEGISKPLSGEFGPLEALNLVGKGLANLAIGGYNFGATLVNGALNPKQSAESADALIKGISDYHNAKDTNESKMVGKLVDEFGDTITDPKKMAEFITTHPFEILSVVAPKQINKFVDEVALKGGTNAKEAYTLVKDAIQQNVTSPLSEKVGGMLNKSLDNGLSIATPEQIKAGPSAPIPKVQEVKTPNAKNTSKLPSNVKALLSEPTTEGTLNDAIQNPNKGTVVYKPRNKIVAKLFGQNKPKLLPGKLSEKAQSLVEANIENPSFNPQVLTQQMKNQIHIRGDDVKANLKKLRTKSFPEEIAATQKEFSNTLFPDLKLDEFRPSEIKTIKKVISDLEVVKDGNEIWDVAKKWDNAFSSIKNKPQSISYSIWRDGRNLLNDLLEGMAIRSDEPGVKEAFGNMRALYHGQDVIQMNTQGLLNPKGGLLNPANLIKAAATSAGLH